MQFAIGDRVLFKKEKHEGEIIRINSSDKVVVLSSGFEMNVSIKDLVKVEEGTNKAISYGKHFFSKDSSVGKARSYKKEKSQNIVKVDLHIELLSKDYHAMENFEIVQIQLNECRSRINKALNSKVTKLEIIHGIGEGILKNEVHAILRDYNLRFYITQDGGSTEVFL